jgi:pilus assembly protein Flp/PilA
MHVAMSWRRHAVMRAASLPQAGARACAASHLRRRKRGEREDVMDRIITYVKSLRHEEGQDLLEYALLVALIAIVAVGAVTAAGANVSTIFNNIAAAL